MAHRRRGRRYRNQRGRTGRLLCPRPRPSKEWISVLKRLNTILIALIYFFNRIGFVGLYFFIPSIVQQMQASTPLMGGLLSSSAAIRFLLGVLILPRIKRFFESVMVFLGVVTAGLLVSATVFLATSLPAIQLVLSSRAACCRSSGRSP